MIKDRRQLKKTIYYTTGCLILLVICSLPIPKILYINTSLSAPLGVYITKDDQHIGRGDFVVLNVPQEVEDIIHGRGWLPPDKPLLKEVYALPGDIFTITETKIFANGTPAGDVYTHDLNGQPLPVLRGEFIVRDGHFLPLATYRNNSFDGRYFGDVPQGLIIKKVVPFLLIPEWLESYF